MILPRLITGLVGGLFFLGTIYFGGLPFFFAILGIVLVGTREFYSLARETGYPCFFNVGMVSAGLMVCSVFLNGLSFGSVTDNQLTSAIFAFIMILIVGRSLVRGPADTSLSEWSVTFMGVFYVAWSLSHLLLIRDLRPGGRYITFFLFTTIWVADIAAYFIGSRWGKHKIAPSISPKKSWEGTIAGVIGAILVSVLFQATVLRDQIRLFEAILLAVVVAILAFLSDLGESILKRGAGVKDSSLVLPGHGGILDRFDSFFLAAPFFYYFWAFLKR